MDYLLIGTKLVIGFIALMTGQIKDDALDSIGKSEQWLKSEMVQMGYVNLKELLYCEWSSTEGFFIKTYKESIN